MMSITEQVQLLRAHGRCTGAMIFSVFGGCWLLMACAYSHRFHATGVIAICLIAGLLVLTAQRTRQNHVEPVLDGTLKQQKRREDGWFAVLNAVTYSAVFLLFLILPRLGLSNFVFPGFVALVGLHFFPMPPLYRHTANLVVGSFMVLWAVFCAVIFKANGNTMAAWLGLGAGVALWCSSLSAIRTARHFFTASAPTGKES